MRVRLLLCAILVSAMLLAGAASVFAAGCCPQTAGSCAKAAPADANAKAKVLCVIGGPFHNWNGLAEYAKTWLDGTGLYETIVTEDRDQFLAANINKYDLVVEYTTGFDLTKEQEQGLIQFVENGKGFVGIHSATDSFKNSDAYWKMVCGKFTGHGHEDFTVKVTGKSHPTVKGLNEFVINDETYCHAFHPESKPIFLTRRVKDGEPVSWVHYYGKGRVFVTGLGHYKVSWDNPGFKQMVLQGMLWANDKLNP